MSKLDWETIATFHAVMRTGSLSAAARSLALAQPTVRRHIEALEAAMGAVLFTRSPTGLTPTDTAHRALPLAEAMASAAAAMARGVSDNNDQLAGTIRLSCSEIMAIEVIPPLLAPFLALHPRLEVELVATNVRDNLLRRDADLAVRMTRPTQAGLVARKAGDIALGLYAAEAYLAAMPAPRSVGELMTSGRMIGQDANTSITDAMAALGEGATPRFVVRSDSDAVQLAAVRAGLGIGICQRPIAQRDPRLSRVLPDLEMAIDCWVVMHEDLRAQPRACALFDYLGDRLARYASHES